MTSTASLTCSPAAAQPQSLNPTDKTINLNVPARESDRFLGVFTLRIDPSGEISINVSALIEALRGTVADDTLGQLLVAAGDDGQITPEEAAITRIGLSFDQQAIELRVALPIDLRQEQKLSLGGGAPARSAKSQALGPAAISGYLNVFAGGFQRDGGGFEPSLSVNNALNIRGVVFETAGTYEGDRSNGFTRDYTRVVFDDTTNVVRYTLGDILSPSVGFQRNQEILGLSVSRRDLLQEFYSSIIPQTAENFQLDRPAMVDVLVNGVPLQSFRLPPGAYSVSDFPFMNDGANDIEIVARHDDGGIRSFTFTRFFDSRLLPVGLYDFGVNAGVAADRDATGLSYDSDRWQGLAFVRRGLTSDVTVGANVGGDRDLIVAGSEIIWASPLGAIALEGAASTSDAGTGVGLEARYRAFLPDRFEDLNAFFDASLRLSSDNFLVERAGAEQPLIAEMSLRYSQSLAGDTTGNVGATYAWNRGGTADRYQVFAGASRAFGPASLSMTASYENDGFRGSDFRVFANLVMRFSPELRGRASYDSRRERASAGVQYISRNRGVGAWTADAQIEHSVNRDMTLSGTAGYTANRFEVSAQRAQALNITGGDDGRETQTRLLVGSSLAFAGGRMALGRPIRDSFAIVGRHATLNDHDVYVDVDRGRRDYAARADEFGPALLPSLAAYSTRRIEYDVEDLPSGYNLGDGLFVVRSTYRSGLSLSVGTDLVASAVGRLVAADETPIAYAVGKVHSLDDDDFAPLDIFTNRVGRFGIQGLRPGDRYRVVLTSPRPTEFEIEVPADTQGLYDMKQVRISGDDPWQ